MIQGDSYQTKVNKTECLNGNTTYLRGKKPLCSKFSGDFFPNQKKPQNCLFFFFLRGRRREKGKWSSCSSVPILAKKKNATLYFKKCFLVRETGIFFLYSDLHSTFANPLLTIYLYLQTGGINLQWNKSWSHDPFPINHFALTAVARSESQFLLCLSVFKNLLSVTK